MEKKIQFSLGILMVKSPFILLTKILVSFQNVEEIIKALTPYQKYTGIRLR